MTVLEIMERVGTEKTGFALAYIQDALAEIQSIINISNKKVYYNLEEDKRFYDYPSDFEKLIAVYSQDDDIDETLGDEILDITIFADNDAGFDANGTALIYTANELASEALLSYNEFAAKPYNNARYRFTYTIENSTLTQAEEDAQGKVYLSIDDLTADGSDIFLSIVDGSHTIEFTSGSSFTTGNFQLNVIASPSSNNFDITAVSLKRVKYKYKKISEIQGIEVSDEDFV